MRATSAISSIAARSLLFAVARSASRSCWTNALQPFAQAQHHRGHPASRGGTSTSGSDARCSTFIATPESQPGETTQTAGSEYEQIGRPGRGDADESVTGCRFLRGHRFDRDAGVGEWSDPRLDVALDVASPVPLVPARRPHHDRFLDRNRDHLSAHLAGETGAQSTAADEANEPSTPITIRRIGPNTSDGITVRGQPV